MKVFLIRFISISFLLFSLLSADIIELEITLAQPDINDYNGYIKIKSPNTTYSSIPGYPQLPQKNVMLLLPPGQSPVELNITEIITSYRELDLPVYPVQTPHPLSHQGEVRFTEPEPGIYSKDNFYPSDLGSKPAEYYYRGLSLCSIKLNNVLYNPVKNELKILEKIKLSLRTESHLQAENAYENFYRKLPDNFSDLIKLDNPENISLYPNIQTNRDETYEYVIITSSLYADLFTDFIQVKMTHGYRTLLKTTEDINTEYSGADLQEKIRNYIIDLYQNFGTEYVLLGGDTEIIPHRGFYVAAGSTIDDDIPSDLYYAGLDRVGTGSGSDWNTDDDGYWGETSEADYLADVYLGRISADTEAEFSAALNKQMLYQTQPVTGDLEKAIMVGENLNDAPLTWGGNYKDEIINGGSYNGYTTTGFPVNFYVQTQYDRSYTWDWTELRDKFNAGVNLVNHLGHSNVSYNMKFYTSNVTNSNLTSDGINHNFYIMYSQGCYPASLDNRDPYGNYGSDCIVEQFTTIDNGCVAFVGNSRYGWYNPGGTDSGSQYLDRQFFDALFGEGITTLAEMHEDSRFDGASQCNSDPWFRWAFYELIVFGDPSLDIWTEEPTSISVSFPASVPLGISQIEISNETPEARVALIQNNNIIGNGITDGTGDITIILDNPVNDVNEISLYVNAHNKVQFQGTIIVVSDEPYITCTSYSIDDNLGNQNDLADYNEEILLDITLENIGNQPGNNLDATLSSSDSYVVISDANVVVGNLDAGEETQFPSAFSFIISDDIPDQHMLDFTLEVTDGNRMSWQSEIHITVNAPDMIRGDLSVNDSDGNNNNILDPGETATMIFEIINQGHSISPATSVELSCEETDITILTSELDLGLLEPAQIAEAAFDVSASAEILPGSPRNFTLDVDCGNYSFIHPIIYSIGLIFDDFESGNLYKFGWESTGDSPWSVVTTDPWEGLYCLQSGAISHYQTSDLIIEGNVLSAGNISFYRQVSSESGYDYLRFYIDDIQQEQWSGEESWALVSYPVDIGEHEFKWIYYKDGSVSNGSDCGWIDYIVFPAMEIPGQPECDISLDEMEFEMNPGENQEESMILSNPGDGDLEFSFEIQYQPYIAGERDWSDPDDYGYTWIDSDDPEGPQFNWYELHPEASEVTFSHNDVATDLIDLDFELEYYGIVYDQFRISPNGWLGFGSDWDDYHNYAIPRTDAPRPAIFSFWDDLDPLQGGNVYYYQDPDSLIIWFNNVIHYPGMYNGTYDFEMILYKTGDILLQYNSMIGDLDTSTIGIQNSTGDDGLQIAYNESYIHNEMAIYIAKPLSWLTVNPISGILSPDTQEEIDISASSEDLASGLYHADLILNTNDPFNSLISIPVDLTLDDNSLNAPSQLKANIAGNSFVISWDNVEGASAYNIYVSDQPYSGFSYLITVYSNSHILPLDYAKKYFKVTAVN